jgi:hypothetical protein
VLCFGLSRIVRVLEKRSASTVVTQ